MRPHREAGIGLALMAVLLGLACSSDDPSSSPPSTTTSTSTSTTVPDAEGPLTEAEARELVASIEGPDGHWEPDTSLPDYAVRFQWDDTTVRPLDPLPPADQGTAG